MVPDWVDVERAAFAQGWVKRRTKKGFFMQAPNGVQVLLHRDPSVAAVRKALSRMKNEGGMHWPVFERGNSCPWRRADDRHPRGM